MLIEDKAGFMFSAILSVVIVFIYFVLKGFGTIEIWKRRKFIKQTGSLSSLLRPGNQLR